MAPEWFCGCKHNGRSPGGGANDTKEAKNHKNKVSPSSVRAFLSLALSQTCKCHIFSKGKKAEKENSKATNGGSKANSNLHSSALEPGTGDVLWAPGLIRVSRSMLDPKRASVTAPASKTLSKQCVRCETCKVGLRLQCA